MRHLSFDLAQAGAAVRAGGVLSAILRAGNGVFHLELETRESGLAELVTANGRSDAPSANPAPRCGSCANRASSAAALSWKTGTRAPRGHPRGPGPTSRPA
ncbi:hypothetical protein [Paraburkholderia sp. SIMBA_030]|uniref:hypothetical protein n=1 Tax=Paraburkholderia sp. SIMBA_030 TaxID=3085773 RepID=UPI00397ABD53